VVKEVRPWRIAYVTEYIENLLTMLEIPYRLVQPVICGDLIGPVTLLALVECRQLQLDARRDIPKQRDAAAIDVRPVDILAPLAGIIDIPAVVPRQTADADRELVRTHAGMQRLCLERASQLRLAGPPIDSPDVQVLPPLRETVQV